MRHRPLQCIFWLFCGLSAVSALSCQDPTQMTLELRTDLACSELQGVSVVVGRDNTDATRKMLAGDTTVPVFSKCDQGNLGTLVLKPGGTTGAVIVRVGAGKTDPLSCLPSNNFSGCIVARRLFSYLEHSSQVLPIRLTRNCIDVPCGVDSTCDDGACKSNRTVCAGGHCDVGTNPPIVVPTTPTSTPTTAPTTTPPVSPPLPLGSVNEDPVACNEAPATYPGQSHCYQVTISGCGNLEPMSAVVLVTQPSATAVGTLLLTATLASSDGVTFDSFPAAAAQIKQLSNEGYRIAQASWRPPAGRTWLYGSEGPVVSACRYATLATWVNQRFYKPGAPNEGKFCALAHGGSTMELAYALTRYGREAIFDYALFSSGPLAKLENHCSVPPVGWDAVCKKIYQSSSACTSTNVACEIQTADKALLDSSFRPSTPCQTGGAAELARLADASPLSPNAQTAFDKTKLEFFAGADDCTTSVIPGAFTFAQGVTSQKIHPSVALVGGVGNGLPATQAGASAIANAARVGCR